MLANRSAVADLLLRRAAELERVLVTHDKGFLTLPTSCMHRGYIRAIGGEESVVVSGWALASTFPRSAYIMGEAWSEEEALSMVEICIRNSGLGAWT